MPPQVQKSSHLLVVWLSGIFLALLSATAIAALLGWIPASKNSRNDSAARTVVAANASNPDKTKCNNCGQIVSVREVAARAATNGNNGADADRMAGVAGNDAGTGRGQDLATIGTAVGRARPTKESEMRKNYEIIVRLDDGSSQTVHETHTPMWRAGDRVSISNGAIQSIR